MKVLMEPDTPVRHTQWHNEEGGDWLGAVKQRSASADNVSTENEPITLGSRANQLQVGLEQSEQNVPLVVDDDNDRAGTESLPFGTDQVRNDID